MVRTLLYVGAEVDLLTLGGTSPLHEACSRDQLDVARALLSAGAKVDLQDKKKGMSALYGACANGHLEVARALLSAGAAADLPTYLGESPLHALLAAGAKADPRNEEAWQNEEVWQAAKERGSMDGAGGQGGVVERLAPGAVLQAPTSTPPPHDAATTVPEAPSPPSPHDAAAAIQEAPSTSSIAGGAAIHPPPPVQAGSQVGGGRPSEGHGGGLSAEAHGCCSSSSSRARAKRVCTMCAGLPSPSAATAMSGGPPTPSSPGSRLLACGRCMSVWYCSAECQKAPWEQGGHKQACTQLRAAREGRKGAAGAEGRAAGA